MTYLEAVNDVLARLRESSVTTVTQTAYSTLIGKFINDGKRIVEDSWNWDALSSVVTLNTVASTSNYTVTGLGLRYKGVSVNNTTSKNIVHNVPIQFIVDQQQLLNTSTGTPTYYAFSGSNGTDAKVELYPTPDGVYTLKFNAYVPQAVLTSDSTVISVPYDPVVHWAYARAIVERGEDGGMSSSEAGSIARNSLSDHIALESTRFVENNSWEAV
jgi:hypothetical protein